MKGDIVMKPYVVEAKVMSKGQVTLPVEVRKQLGVSSGDRIVFVVTDEGVFIINSAVAAIKFMQSMMKGEADRLGLKTEEDVVELIKEVRHGKNN